MVRPSSMSSGSQSQQSPQSSPISITTSAVSSRAQRRGSRTANACEACKKRKTKCSGPPGPCESCRKVDTFCHFNLRLDTRRKLAYKPAALRERQQYILESLMHVLRHTDSADVAKLLTLIRGEARPQEIASCLRQNIQSLQSRAMLSSLDVDETDLMSLGLQGLYSHRAGKFGHKQSQDKEKDPEFSIDPGHSQSQSRPQSRPQSRSHSRSQPLSAGSVSTTWSLGSPVHLQYRCPSRSSEDGPASLTESSSISSRHTKNSVPPSAHDAFTFNIHDPSESGSNDLLDIMSYSKAEDSGRNSMKVCRTQLNDHTLFEPFPLETSRSLWSAQNDKSQQPAPFSILSAQTCISPSSGIPSDLLRESPLDEHFESFHDMAWGTAS